MPERRIPEIERGLNRLIWATVALFLVVGAAIVIGYVLNESRRQDTVQATRRADAQIAHTAKVGRLELCLKFETLRRREARRQGREVKAAEKQLARTERFLREHPEGAPSLGFTADEIRRSLVEMRRDLDTQRREQRELRPLPGRSKADPTGCYKFSELKPPKEARRAE